MNLHIEYQENTGLWAVSCMEALGQLGPIVLDRNRDDAVFRLGVQLGRNPQDFTRPLGEYFGEATK
jgi:hypothetical protein